MGGSASGGASGGGNSGAGGTLPRMQKLVLTATDGTKFVHHWIDNDLQLNCAPQPMADGPFRCAPMLSSAEIYVNVDCRYFLAEAYPTPWALISFLELADPNDPSGAKIPKVALVVNQIAVNVRDMPGIEPITSENRACRNGTQTLRSWEARDRTRDLYAWAQAPSATLAQGKILQYVRTSSNGEVVWARAISGSSECTFKEVNGYGWRCLWTGDTVPGSSIPATATLE